MSSLDCCRSYASDCSDLELDNSLVVQYDKDSSLTCWFLFLGFSDSYRGLSRHGRKPSRNHLFFFVLHFCFEPTCLSCPPKEHLFLGVVFPLFGLLPGGGLLKRTSLNEGKRGFTKIVLFLWFKYIIRGYI